MLQIASTITAPMIEAIHPGASLGPYQPIAWPKNLAANAPTMPRIAVRTNPEGSFGPEWISLAMTPTMKPTIIVPIMLSNSPSVQALVSLCRISEGMFNPGVRSGGARTVQEACPRCPGLVG